MLTLPGLSPVVLLEPGYSQSICTGSISTCSKRCSWTGVMWPT